MNFLPGRDLFGKTFLIFETQRVNEHAHKLLVILIQSGDVDGFVPLDAKQIIGRNMKCDSQFFDDFRGRDAVADLIKTDDGVFYAYQGGKLLLREFFLLAQLTEFFTEFYHIVHLIPLILYEIEFFIW